MLSGAAFTLKHSGSGQVLLKGKPRVNISTAAEAQAAAQRARDLPLDQKLQPHTSEWTVRPEGTNVFSLL